MNLNIYATVGDTVQFATHPKGGETYKGEKGNWKTIEGTFIVDNVECLDAEDFAAKSAAIKVLWPTATIRFIPEKKAWDRP